LFFIIYYMTLYMNVPNNNEVSNNNEAQANNKSRMRYISSQPNEAEMDNGFPKTYAYNYIIRDVPYCRAKI